MKGFNAIGAAITFALLLGYLLTSKIPLLMWLAIKVVAILVCACVAYYLFLVVSAQTRSIVAGLFAGGGFAFVSLLTVGALL